uniref:alpha,alpha-trehalose-phosphate synthase [UDP-forming] 5-like n=1 Tax=Erigeron canadensis TaxID=72917 RepID=UPI001CB99B55|nr:alpha,alpha-trehalose-phosphate synthase [UDP-forming] 5-like [Erigeron canadensis]
MEILAFKTLKCKGQAWVVFEDVLSATNALIHMQGELFFNKPMMIDGSTVEDKETALVWFYEDAGPEFGSCQAKELIYHLENVLANEPVIVKRGHSVGVKLQRRGKMGGLVGVDVDDDKIELLLSEVKGKDITELIAFGREKLAFVPSGGGDVAIATAADGGVAPVAAAAESKKEEKVEEK